MRSYISIGSAPSEEECAQVGDPDYRVKAVAECRRFIVLLREMFGAEPEGAKLAVKAFPHDFGTYHEVVCYYDESMQEAVDYAFKVEANVPATWGADAPVEVEIDRTRSVLDSASGRVSETSRVG